VQTLRFHDERRERVQVIDTRRQRGHHRVRGRKRRRRLIVSPQRRPRRYSEAASSTHTLLELTDDGRGSEPGRADSLVERFCAFHDPH
jgi:hypothetical protein